MVPSPRKRVPRPRFDQTWDDSDAAFLDPTSLPVARIPRGWERKQETKKTDQGREKKIWRRFNLRSRAAPATREESEEKHDARSRAVKKQQHISPQAMEKTALESNGKTRTYKATRWDRRKSVLPRKKPNHSESFTTTAQEVNEYIDDTQDATLEAQSDESFESDSKIELERIALPVIEERRTTFTFTMDTEANVDLPDYESLNGLDELDHEDSESTMQTEDTTLAQLFRSPSKTGSNLCFEPPEDIEYPKLPQSDHEQTESETTTSQLVVAEKTTVVPQADDNCMLRGEEETIDFDIDIEGNVAEGEACEEPGLQETISLDEAPESIDITLNLTSEPPPTKFSSASEVTYPTLPSEDSPRNSRSLQALSPLEEQIELANQDVEMSEVALDSDLEKNQDPDMADDVVSDLEADFTTEEQFTETSLQFDLQRDYQATVEEEQPILHEGSEETVEANTETPILSDDSIQEAAVAGTLDEYDLKSPVEAPVDDIANGLTLSFTPAKIPSLVPTPRKLHSPPPPPIQSSIDDATMTIALDDDTALLKDFLNRAAASKAEKAAVSTHRRESLRNRRDSDVIRHALASPRKALEEKDPNSPAKYDTELTLDLSQTLTLNMDSNALASPLTDQSEHEDPTDEKSSRGSRRSSRTKKSRLPAPASVAQAQTSKIAIRRTDGNEHVVLKKSDAQEMATLTRANTRKNKQGAFGVTVRLMKLAADAANLPPLDDSTKELVVGKNIRWDEQLTYYQENPETVAERESLATPDELSMPDAASTPSAKPKSKISKNSTPKMRRVRGLGTVNGTPGKTLLAQAPLLSEAVPQVKESTAVPAQQLPRPKASKTKKIAVATITGAPVSTPLDSKLPSLDIIPVGVEPTKERKSRLAAPKKVMLPPSLAAVAAEGKENTQRTGIGAATPRKGIPAPKVIVPPSVGVESGLPRRRGRKA
ncbi:hypothetical protein GQ44DRAFT_759855 [Phaeosphaeriaceae sp. PMI808]|nr:hypothetical protein GQ44DRAFT_759855 [Phaeosphaeriaceae sp. PMI808]